MADQSGTILLIDENLFFVDKLKHQAEAAGYATRSAMFEAAIEPALAAGAPAAIVVNLDADRMDALEVIRRLHARPELAGTPIIGFAGHVHADLLDAAQGAGATRTVSNGQIANGLAKLLRDLCPTNG